MTILLPGRHLDDLIDYGGKPMFFGSKGNRTQYARWANPLTLLLDVAWHPLSRVLAHLG